MKVLSHELLGLGAKSAARSDPDAMLATKCQKAEKEREEFWTLFLNPKSSSI